MTAPTLDTERLRLRHFRADDFEPYVRIATDPDVTRYLGTGAPATRVDAWRQITGFIGHWTMRGYGVWAVEERATGTLVGRIGLHNPEGWPGIELIWTLGKEHWGKGYATEGARRALQYAFAEVRLPRVISLIRPANAASIRVAQRIGERLVERTELFAQEALVYGIDRLP